MRWARAGVPVKRIVAAHSVALLPSRRRNPNPKYSIIDRAASAHAADLCYIPAPMARWQSGYAAACKAADTGSIPVLASTSYAVSQQVDLPSLREHDLSRARVAELVDAADLKSASRKGSAGSSPALGTN